MANLLLQERLQPSLLDRLTDDAPDSLIETAASRSIDLSRLRQIIQRDLSWLLNTANFGPEFDPETYPNVARSVVNYGLPDISGRTGTMRRVSEYQHAIRTAIETFEPRILSETLEVTARSEKIGTGAIISFDIRGELWAEPVPIDLYLRTALDVTTGEVTVKKQG